MPACSLCKERYDQEGSTILFTDSRGIPFVVCAKCEGHVDVMRSSKDDIELKRSLDYISDCTESIGNREINNSLLKYVRENKRFNVKISRYGILAFIIVLLIFSILNTISAISKATNDAAMNKFAQQLFAYPLPDQSTKVAELEFRGSGNKRDSMEYDVILVLKSNLTKDAMNGFYQNFTFQTISNDSQNKAPVEIKETDETSSGYIISVIRHKKMYSDDSLYQHYYEIRIVDEGPADFIWH